ncbi:DNA-binding response regulator, OmpR family, contains REC and winged-helix (wHTH) domain [Bryocella elongata]|uniref:Phosphate regulon transcriptional regulatory protein PhoB n=1 Tax=Bryocella elongata TaxID=863522 RepID=A0A1H5UR19_9BACT|nr:response regulator transcription factor [Bryocella elongata]SEF77533.1 DNA-binding response regulator, OmpR family, contains REC and winged-helix (wHTH) domain [Bryocella elongata]
MGIIVLIEDDTRIQRALRRLFEGENYEVQVLNDGVNAKEATSAVGVEAVVLDLMLPKISGREVCRSIKDRQPNLPVVILSAVSEVADKVLLLELGADDYMTKPFSPRELLARVQAAIRRCNRMGVKPSAPKGFGDVIVDLEQMEVVRAGRLVSLTAQEFKLLRYFFENPTRVISRQQLLTEVWGYESYPTTRTVDNQILKLRQKLEPNPTEPRYLRTIHGAGYKFVPEG